MRFAAHVVAAAVLLGAPASAAAQWLSLQTDHFRVIGNASESQLRSVALRLEQFREVVSQLNPALLREDSAPPVVVLVFRNARTYEPFMPVSDGKVVRVGGMFVGARDVNYITLNIEAGELAYPTIFHEFSHLLTRGVFADAPLWFNEGLAEYYRTFQVADGGRRAEIGRPVAEHVELLRQRTLPLSRFFSIDRNSREYSTNTIDRQVMYAQAWAIIHHAFHGDSKRRDQLLAFINKVAAGSDPVTSFRDTYHIEPRDLEIELQNYTRVRQSWRFVSYDFPERITTRAQVDVRRISDPEADAWLGDLLAHMGRTDEGAVHLQRALKTQPDLAIGHAAMGMLYLRQQKTTEAMEHLGRAVADGSANEGVQFAYAFALVSSGAKDEESMTRASAALERATRLRPGFTEAKLLLAYTYLRTARYAAARDLLTPVVRAEPANHEAALRLGEALLRLDDFRGARDVLGPLMGQVTSEEDRARVRDLLGMSAKLENRQKTLTAAGIAPQGPAPAAAAPPAARSAAPAGGPPTTRPVFRRVAADEQRVHGVFEAVECGGAAGVFLVVRTANSVLRARATSLADVDFIAHRELPDRSVTCGRQAPPFEVYLTWRVPPGAIDPTEGTAVAIEILPEGFVP